MKKKLIVVLLAMLGGALLFQVIRSESGYVLFAFAKTSVEMSLWTALVIWLASFCIFYWGWRLASGSKKLGKFVLGERAHSPRVQQKTFEALVNFIEGNWQLARKQLVKNAPRSGNPLVNYLAAARCAYEQDDFSGALDLLHKAEKSQGSSELAVALTQARMQLGSQRYEQCLATLKRIKRVAPEHPVVLDLLADVYWALREFDALEELLPTLRQLSIRTPEALKRLEIDVYLLQLSKLNYGRKRELEQPHAKTELDAVWQRVPPKLRQEPELMAGFAAALHRCGCDQEAEPWLHKALQKQWKPEWVELYGHLQADSAAQLKVAAVWEKKHDADADLMATLGRLSMRNQLWGKARDYLRQSLDMEARPDVYCNLAELHEQLGDMTLSADVYREGLVRVTATQKCEKKA